ncbi:MAG: hypothetical protein LBF90_03225 [Prevotellaceae bacterium]|jgi:hypothetical protein|nr:hypothetical protein [Prevotellaceae bacterium]
MATTTKTTTKKTAKKATAKKTAKKKAAPKEKLSKAGKWMRAHPKGDMIINDPRVLTGVSILEILKDANYQAS